MLTLGEHDVASGISMLRECWAPGRESGSGAGCAHSVGGRHVRGVSSRIVRRDRSVDRVMSDDLDSSLLAPCLD